MTVDYATDTISNIDENKTIIATNNTTVLHKNAGHAVTDGKIYVENKKTPTIAMWAKPSVRSKYAYKWYYKEFVDYCPNCRHYNVLLKNPKGVPEHEYTCRRCDSDFCAVTGKEKYSWSHTYLIPA